MDVYPLRRNLIHDANKLAPEGSQSRKLFLNIQLRHLKQTPSAVLTQSTHLHQLHRPSIVECLHLLWSSAEASAPEHSPPDASASILRWSARAGWRGPEGGALPTTAWRKAKRCHGDRAAKKISLYCYHGNNCR